MLIIPYSTDAPIYHWPIATVGTIVANTFIFLTIATMPEDGRDFVESWLVLTFGNFNPITWISCNYMHMDIFHLLGNMLFLWVFGLIVEGKIGWWKFLIAYNLAGVAFGAALQIITIFFSEGSALGASAAIYGLMAMVMIWAPVNAIHTLVVFTFFFRFFIQTLEIPAYVYVGLNLCVQFLFASFAIATAEHPLAAITSETLHLAGAAVGAGIGLYMLHFKLVDCENWDAFSVWQGKHTKSREQLQEDYVKSEEGQKKIQQVRETSAEQVRKYLSVGENVAAWAAYKRAVNQFPGWQLPENDLLMLIAGMRKAAMWDETITLMVTFLRTYPQRDAAVRLALAQILIDKKQRGAQACKVLDKVQIKQLDPRQVPILESFRTKARAMADDDPYEVAAEDW